MNLRGDTFHFLKELIINLFLILNKSELPPATDTLLIPSLDSQSTSNTTFSSILTTESCTYCPHLSHRAVIPIYLPIVPTRRVLCVPFKVIISLGIVICFDFSGSPVVATLVLILGIV